MLEYIVRPTKIEQYKTLMVKNQETGKEQYVHSLYDPVREAKLWVQKVYDEKKEIYIVFGGGFYYHIKELLSMVSQSVYIIVVEPDNQIFELSKEESLLREIIKDDRFLLIKEADGHKLYVEMKNIFYDLNTDYFKVCAFGIYEQLYSEIYLELTKSLRRITKEKLFYINTKETFALEHVDNMLHNIRYMEKSVFPNVFANVFSGYPAVIVSAGPSLEKNIDLLKGREKDVLIITGGRTLKPLLEKGIKPHFVVSADGSYENFLLFKDVLDCDVPLLAAWVCNKHIISKYKGEKVFSNNSDVDGLDKDIFGEEITEIYANGTVAVLQLDFARWLGCTNVALIGQDLAETGDKTHAGIASHGINDMSTHSQDIKVKGNIEEFIYTNVVFKHYIEIFEWYINETKNVMKVYNCTEGGAYIEGTEVEELKKFLDNYSVKDMNFEKQIGEIISANKRSADQMKSKEIFKAMKRASSECIVCAERARKLTENILTKKTVTKLEMQQLDKLDKKIKKHRKILKLADRLSARTLDNIGKLRLDKNKSEEEQFKDFFRMQRSMYATIEGTYRAFNKLLMESMKEYDE